MQLLSWSILNIEDVIWKGNYQVVPTQGPNDHCRGEDIQYFKETPGVLWQQKTGQHGLHTIENRHTLRVIQNTPVRPITSSWHSPTYGVAKFLLLLLIEQLQRKIYTYSKNATHFIEIKRIELETLNHLFSFKVENPFTSEFFKEEIYVIGKKLHEDDTLHKRTSSPVKATVDLLSCWLFNLCFYAEKKFCLQKEGLSIQHVCIYFFFLWGDCTQDNIFKTKAVADILVTANILWPHKPTATYHHIYFGERKQQVPSIPAGLGYNKSWNTETHIYRKLNHTGKDLNRASNHPGATVTLRFDSFLIKDK